MRGIGLILARADRAAPHAANTPATLEFSALWLSPKHLKIQGDTATRNGADLARQQFVDLACCPSYAVLNGRAFAVEANTAIRPSIPQQPNRYASEAHARVRPAGGTQPVRRLLARPAAGSLSHGPMSESRDPSVVRNGDREGSVKGPDPSTRRRDPRG